MDNEHRSYLILLGQDGSLTRIVWHALEREFGPFPAILEEPVPVLQLLRRRVKKLGFIAVLGQLLFRTIAYPFLQFLGRKRIDAIKREFGLDDSPIVGPVVRVPSVNSDVARQVLRDLDPAVVVVGGTRIIGKETLGSVPATFINMHAGITPRFRGVHGGYWALADGHPELVGTTVHLVDEGIDTGGVIDQALVHVSPSDSFATYPYLQTGSGIPLLVKAVGQALDGNLETKHEESAQPSRLRFHPTLWGYLAKRVSKGVR
ncbi:MAG: formyl transferase [Actinomycetota bacterium]